MTDTNQNSITILVEGAGTRGGAVKREQVPVEKLSVEVKAFVADIAAILAEAANIVTGKAKLTEVEVSASIEMGGKLSLLGTGIETKGQAGIHFKFEFPKP